MKTGLIKSLLLIIFILAININFCLSQKPELVVQMGHIRSVESVSFSPDGKYALSGSWDKTLKLWDISTGKEIRTFQGHKSVVSSVSFSPDGKYAISGSGDNTLKLWDIETGKEIRTFEGHKNWVTSVSFSPDGKYAISGSGDTTLKLWDISTGKEIRTFQGHTRVVSSVSFSTDGKYAISGSGDKTLKLWDIETGKEIRTFEGHKYYVNSVTFSPDGKYALSGSWDETLKLWDISTGKEIRTFEGHKDYFRSVSFSPDGKYALSGSLDSNLKLWDIYTGKEIRTFEGHKYYVNSVSFSPDGKYALSGSGDNTLKLWDISTGKEIRTFEGHKSRVSSVSFSPDGKYALSGSFDKTLKLWDIETGKEIRTFEGHISGVNSVSFSPDGNYALSGSWDETLKLWDIETGKEIRTIRGHKSFVLSVSFSPDGKYAISGSWDKTLKLWDISTGKEIRTFEGHKNWVNSVSFSPDGKYALSGSDDIFGYDNTLKLWDISTGKEIRTFEGHKYGVSSVTFSPDGKYALSGSWDRTLKLWDIWTGKELVSLISFPNNDFVIVTPDGYFDGTPAGMKNMHYVNGMEIIPLDSYFENYYTSGLLKKVMNGEKYQRETNVIKFTAEDMKIPEVTIESPKDGAEFKSREIDIEMSITDGKYPTEMVRIYLNGKCVVDSPKGFGLAKTYKINLVEGDNKITVRAYDVMKTGSKEKSITVKCLKKDKPDLYIFACAINDYDEINDLQYCVKDADELTEKLMEINKPVFNNIFVEKVYNTDATRDNILNKLERISQNAKEEDVFIFYYSGHGGINTGTIEDDRSYYIMMRNSKVSNMKTTGISSKELGEMLKKIKPLKQLIIFDACYAGGFWKDIAVYMNRGTPEEEASNRLAMSTGVFIFSAAGKDQTAKEINDLKHGIFTYTLLEGLSCNSSLIGKNDGLILNRELAEYTEKRVMELSKKYNTSSQIPKFFSVHDFDFPIGICR